MDLVERLAVESIELLAWKTPVLSRLDAVETAYAPGGNYMDGEYVESGIS